MPRIQIRFTLPNIGFPSPAFISSPIPTDFLDVQSIVSIIEDFTNNHHLRITFSTTGDIPDDFDGYITWSVSDYGRGSHPRFSRRPQRNPCSHDLERRFHLQPRR